MKLSRTFPPLCVSVQALSRMGCDKSAQKPKFLQWIAAVRLGEPPVSNETPK